MQENHSDVWQLQEAKARLSAVMRAAREFPQYITIRGKEEFVVLPKQEYYALKMRKKGKKAEGSFGQFLAKSPLCGANITVERDKTPLPDPKW